MSGRVLLLNSDMTPHDIRTDEEAICMILEDEVEVLVYSDRVMHSQFLDMRVPEVMVLHRWVMMPERHNSILVVTKTVLARDDHTCAYCGKKGLTVGIDGTMDHIKPRARGGKHEWINVVSACKKCNSRKGHKLLSELGCFSCGAAIGSRHGSPPEGHLQGNKCKTDPTRKTEVLPEQGWRLGVTPYIPYGIPARLLSLRPHDAWMPYLNPDLAKSDSMLPRSRTIDAE